MRNLTDKDARKIIAVIMVTYPNYKPIDTDLAATVWADAMKEYTYEQVDVALKMYIRTNTSGFAPAPGQLMEQLQSMTQPQELNEMEAWALVSKAIRNSGYNSVEEFSKLPPIVQKAVGLPSQLRIWALDENYNEQVVSSNFIKCYRNEVAREREISKMPSEVRQLIQNTAQGSYSAQIEDLREQTVKSLTERKESGTKALEDKSEGIPMPNRLKEKMEEWRNDKCGQNTEYE